MDTGFDVGDGNRPPRVTSALAKLVGWLLHLVGPSPRGLGELTEWLLAAFQRRLPVSDPEAGQWYATLDAIDPADNQVAAWVRLSRNHPPKVVEVRRGLVDFEEPNQGLYPIPAEVPQGEDHDLLLTYSFPILLSNDKNLELFRELAGNELRRLRMEAASKE
jgi:hypothetical protein